MLEPLSSCLTSIVKNKKHIRDFIGREDPELKYLAGLETLRAFSSMNNGKGLPRQAEVETVLGWLPSEGQINETLQKLMVRLYTSAGIPDTKKLKHYGQKLLNPFFAPTATGLESDMFYDYQANRPGA